MRVASHPEEEAAELLRALVRINTVNPPGDERRALALLADYLEDAGLECRMFALDPARPNLVARLRGRRPGPTLAYLGHVDTVLADPSEWTHDPWSGEIADGCLWGRGALDMKSQVAAEAAAAAALARRGARPAEGDLLLVFVSDEEAGGRYGARFLTETHPEQVRCDFLLNEGGGAVIEHGGRRLYPVSCAEKGVFRFTVTTSGVAGHASVPGIADNALLRMVPLLERLGAAVPTLEPPGEVVELLAALGEAGEPRAALERLREQAPDLAALVDPMLGITLSPTRITASDKVNVIPSRARVEVDCRVPPGTTEPVVRRAVQDVLGPDGYELTFDTQRVGNRSPAQSTLMSAIGAWIGEADPGAATVPVVDPGFTDSHWFRAAFPDCAAYGFFPQRHMSRVETSALIHGPDERIDLRDLALATRFFAELPVELLGWSAPAYLAAA